MSWVTISLSAGTLFGMAVVLTYILGWANKAFHVETDPRVDAIMDALPGANCGGCGFVGCGEYAEAVVLGSAPVDRCPVGGEGCAAEVADVMGVEVGGGFPYRPIVHCGAGYEERLLQSPYRGEQRCQAANLVTDVQGCIYGCLGYGDCTRACAFDAIHIEAGLAMVDYDKCVGCGACAVVCPRNIISMVPFKQEQMLAVVCSNKDAGKEVKRVCTVGCLACKACERMSELFKVTDNLSTIDYDAYAPEKMEAALKACKKCTRNRLVFVGKPTDEDVAAVVHEEVPEVATADFKTTVDDTEWRG